MNNKALRRTLGMIALLAVHGTAQAASAPVPDALRDAVLKVLRPAQSVAAAE